MLVESALPSFLSPEPLPEDNHGRRPRLGNPGHLLPRPQEAQAARGRKPAALARRLEEVRLQGQLGKAPSQDRCQSSSWKPSHRGVALTRTICYRTRSGGRREGRRRRSFIGSPRAILSTSQRRPTRLSQLRSSPVRLALSSYRFCLKSLLMFWELLLRYSYEHPDPALPDRQR